MISLASETAYDVRGLAANETGTGSASAIASAATLPNAQTGLAAAAGLPAYSVADLARSASATDGSHDAVASYTEPYRVTGAGTWATAASGVTGTSCAVTGLAHATGSDFAVCAVRSRSEQRARG
jgi:hypothetical protein